MWQENRKTLYLQIGMSFLFDEKRENIFNEIHFVEIILQFS